MFDWTIGTRSEGSVRGHAKRKNWKSVHEWDARIGLAPIALCLIGMGIWSAAVSYNRTQLSNPQVTAVLMTHPQDVRARALASLRDDYGFQAPGNPVTRGQLRDAIDAATRSVEHAK